MIDPLVERAQQGDREALGALVEQLAPVVYRFGRRMCRDPHDAEDVVQDTLLALTLELPRFEGRSSLTSWVYMLARTACSRKRRGLKNQPSIPETDAPEPWDPAPSPEDHAAGEQLRTALERALASLPEVHREVIVLRDIEGLPAADAAEVLGIRVDALKSRLHRARSALKDALAPAAETLVRPSTCSDVEAMWSRKLDGDLSHEDCASMEAHLAGCPSCALVCDALRQALAACKAAPGPAVPLDVQTRVKRALGLLGPMSARPST